MTGPAFSLEGREVALELRQIIKKFPGVLANDRVDLTIYAGEVHALLGENGAGKSTLMKVVYGLYRRDGGEILVRGRPYDVRSPQAAMALGIGMVHQHFMLIPNISIIENIVLGLRSDRYPLLRLDEAARRVQTLVQDFGLAAALDTKVGKLTVGQQQKVEIIKALYRGARLLILDEPTAVLLPQETEELFKLIEKLRAGGVTIVFISHKLNEVLQISDRVTVMRRGRVVRTLITRQTSPAELAESMVGQAVELSVVKQPRAAGAPRLVIEDAHARDDLGTPKLNGLRLALRAGEIHGLAGVDGNGQQTLVEALMGLRGLERGRILFADQDITSQPTAQRLRAGVVHIPENRHTEGLVLGLSVTDNLLLDVFEDPPYAQQGWRQFKVMNEHAEQLTRAFDIRTPSPAVEVRKLSGGNQQKVILARALWRRPTVLIAMQPTRGLDVGAASFIHKRLVEARDQGCALLIVSSELDEIIALSDVISVIYEGRIVETRPTAETNLNRIGFLMAGGQPDQAPTGPTDAAPLLT
ncbi:MAG: ABC transporter ATP-binding protein [Anaerolineales bacterium]|nr:ABC transporter ATP-binding protein [Anaerolineales bacterium]